MDDESAFLSLSELCTRASVTTRTVRYYIQQGLLVSPGAGRGARYSQEHLDRLRLVKELQKQHLPLAEIRQRLSQLGAEQIRELLQSTKRPERPRDAVEYVKSVLARQPSGGAGKNQRAEAAPEPSAQPDALHTTWERIVLSPDVELHIRRPLSRLQDRRVRQFLALSKDIFGEGAH